MTKETEKKSMGWLKGVLSNRNEFEQIYAEQQSSNDVTDNNPGDLTESSSSTEDLSSNLEEQSSGVEEQAGSTEEQDNFAEEPEQTNTSSNNPLFSKENQDKTSLDLIVSLENMLKDRQLLLYKNKGLSDQLYTANETITRFKHDQMKKDQLLQEKNKEIRALEGNLTNKQMNYDQLLEDYKEYQSTANNEYEKISNQLEKATSKYNKLNEETTNAQYQSMLRINEFEEKVRNLEIENHKYAEQRQQILDEKAELMQTINDFTERMSFSFSPKTTTSTASSDSSE